MPFVRYGAQCVSINGPSDLDLETGMRVASKVGNLPSKFGHAGPLGSRIIRYVRDRWTDGRTKEMVIAPFPTGGGVIIKQTNLDLLQLDKFVVKMRALVELWEQCSTVSVWLQFVNTDAGA